MQLYRSILCSFLFVALAATANGQFTTVYYFDQPIDFLSEESSISPAGDVNGDGVPDLLIGTPGEFVNAQGFPRSGLVRVVSGADGSNIHVLSGSANSKFGASIDRLGDVNNDGFDDFIVGSPNFGVTPIESGLVSVISGIDGTTIHSMQGFAAFEAFGSSVAGLGDMDGDGTNDFAVGAPGFMSLSGNVLVFSGASGSTIYSFLSPTSLGAGVNFANARDVNNDGVDDIIIGYPRYMMTFIPPTQGLVRVQSGAGGVLHTFLAAGPDMTGGSVGGVGDINGDGFADLIVGEPERFNVNGGRGRVRIFSGSNGGVLRTIVATSPGTILGGFVGGVGDIDGDTVGDYAIRQTDSFGANSKFKLFSGASGLQFGELQGPVAAAEVNIKIAALGDLNSDGKNDVAVGAFPVASNPPTSADQGEVRVYLSGIAPIASYQSNSGNAPAMNLSWIPNEGFSNHPIGTLAATGAAAGASGLVLVSLAPADIPVLGFDLLTAVDPVNLLALANIAANPIGNFIIAEVSRRSPAIAGTTLFVQFIQVAPSVQASNGIKLIVIP